MLSGAAGAVCRSAQRRLVELHLSGTATSLTEQDWQQLLTGTEGLSGSDLAELTQHALYQPLRELESAASWRRLGDGQLLLGCRRLLLLCTGIELFSVTSGG